MAQDSPKKAKAYYGLYICIAALLIISVFVSYSLSGVLWKSVAAAVASLAIIFGISKISYTAFTRPVISVFALLVAIGTLGATLAIGSGGGGRSLNLGGRQIQTFYLITTLVVFYLSVYLTKKHKEYNGAVMPRNDHIAILAVLLAIIGMIALRNISTAVLLTATCLCLLFVGNTKFKYLLYFVLLIGTLGVSYLTIHSLKGSKSDSTATELVENEEEGNKTRGTTGFNRIKYFLTGESDVQGYGRQMVMAKTAIARSLMHPAGPGKGMISERMSEGENDFVFAMICEELSAFVGFTIIITYIVFLNLSLYVARKAKEGSFARHYSVGIAVLITGQALVHIAVNIGMIPATGQTLPFISSGLMNLLVTSIAMGVFINIAKRTNWDIEDEEAQEN